MVKKRLIPVLYIKNGFIVRSENFSEHKIIGNVVNEVRRYNQWDIDELVYIDISREKSYDSGRDDHRIKRINSIFDILELVSKECFMPLTFGGGIRDLQTIREFLKRGADKVVINTLIHKSPDKVREAVDSFGSQAIVASVDYRLVDGQMQFFMENGQSLLPLTEQQMVLHIESLGCGEVFVTSMDKDGTGEGYDIQTIINFGKLFRVPVIFCGGAIGSFDFLELAKIESVSGIAAGNMFHFTENAYPRSKKVLKEKGLNFR